MPYFLTLIHRFRSLCSGLLLIILIPLIAHAETSLWRVSKEKNSLLIGGSVHLLSSADYPLPDEYEQAFRESELLVLETDMDALSKPEVQMRLARQLIYNDGTRLKDHIKPFTLKALARYCRATGMSFEQLQTMKPALVVLTLTLNRLKESGLAGMGVDEYYLKKAKTGKKPVKGLESIETQIEALASMGAGQEDELILSTIKDLKKTDTFMDKLTGAWRKGNLIELEKLGINPMKSQFPKLNESLLSSRNSAWLSKIEAMLDTPGKEFILTGVLHLAGKDGVLAQLQKKGYLVQQY